MLPSEITEKLGLKEPAIHTLPNVSAKTAKQKHNGPKLETCQLETGGRRWTDRKDLDTNSSWKAKSMYYFHYGLKNENSNYLIRKKKEDPGQRITKRWN